MKRIEDKPISQTNKYALNPEIREKMITRSVLSSSAVEGIYLKLGTSKKTTS